MVLLSLSSEEPRGPVCKPVRKQQTFQHLYEPIKAVKRLEWYHIGGYLPVIIGSQGAKLVSHVYFRYLGGENGPVAGLQACGIYFRSHHSPETSTQQDQGDIVSGSNKAVMAMDLSGHIQRHV